MKILTIALCAFLVGNITAHAQKLTADKVPVAVREAFKAKFARATKVEWKLEHKTEYEAKFNDGSLEQSASFDATGKWLETETEIKVIELPNPVREAIDKQFPAYRIKEVSKVSTPKDSNFYEADLSKGNEILEVQLSPSGAILNKKTERKGDND